MSVSPAACPQCGNPLPAGHPTALCPACLLKLGFESRDPAAGTAATTAYQPRFLVPTPDELAPRFPQLEILEQIGHGGMGVVYRARQKDLDRIVALKILRPDFSPAAGFAERFQREARALARLNHPHSVTVHDFGRNDDLFYFVMEFIDGTNLRQLEQTGQLTPPQALALVPQVCAALQYAHEQGVVHRDIKPENILITRDGRVKIADFGLAKLAGHAEQPHLTGTWQVMGTPHYMAPEQVERPTEVDHRADIFSLGVVLYEMLTGELPLGRFPLPSHRAQIDVRLDEVVLRALEKEPERRYQHATDVQTDVEQIRQTPGAPPRRPTVPQARKERASSVADLEFPGNVLAILGVLELVVSVPAMLIEPVVGIPMLVLGMIAVWTGLSAKVAENYVVTVTGCVLTMIPLSMFWLLKIPFAIMLIVGLREPAIRAAFQWPLLWEWGRGLFDRISRWGGAAGDRLRGRLDRLPERSASLGQSALRVARHPIVWTTAAFLGWSAFWSVYCIIVGVVAADATESAQRRGGWPLDRHWMHTVATTTTILCWLLGEVVLLMHGLRGWTRTDHSSSSPVAGAQSALLAAATATGIAGSLLLVTSAFDNFSRMVFPTPALPGPMLHLVQLGWAQLVFAIVCVSAAALLTWNAVRWVTRLVLLFALVLPAGALLAAAAAPTLPKPLLLLLLPLGLSLPALFWGMWGTRRRISETRSGVEPPDVVLQESGI
jgi:predicted Ser/Thr protein kinase